MSRHRHQTPTGKERAVFRHDLELEKGACFTSNGRTIWYVPGPTPVLPSPSVCRAQCRTVLSTAGSFCSKTGLLLASNTRPGDKPLFHLANDSPQSPCHYDSEASKGTWLLLLACQKGYYRICAWLKVTT